MAQAPPEFAGEHAVMDLAQRERGPQRIDAVLASHAMAGTGYPAAGMASVNV